MSAVVFLQKEAPVRYTEGLLLLPVLFPAAIGEKKCASGAYLCFAEKERQYSGGTSLRMLRKLLSRWQCGVYGWSSSMH